MDEWRRKGRWRRRFILIFGGTLILFLLVRGLLDWTAAGAVDSALAGFEQRWGVLDPASLGPPEVPSSRNRARCYRAAADLLDFDGKSDNEILRGRGNTLGAPQAVARDPNAVREVLKRNRLPLELVAEAANRPGSDWEIAYEKGVEARPPDLLDLLHVSRLVAARASLQILEEDPQAALESLHQGYLLAGSIRQEPMLLTQMVGISVEREMTDVLRQMAAAGPLEPGALDRLRVILSGLPGRGTFHEALKAEVTAMHMVMEDISAGARSEVMDPEPVWIESFSTWVVRPAIRRAHVLYLEEMDRIITRQGMPRHRREPHDHERELPWYGKLFSAVPNMEKMLLRMDIAAARRSLAYTTVALLRYRRDQGEDAPGLEELVPAYLDEVPMDPFTGNPFEYTAGEEGFILRSTGDDPELLSGWTWDTVLRWEIPRERRG